MPPRPSLLATWLRAHRARAGEHGRMTQEQLAERLGVSVEAVSKYERSQSFVRGDFEHRLIERLGWSPSDVAEARADWESRRLGHGAAEGYVVSRGAELGAAYGGDPEAAARDVTRLVDAEMPGIAPGFGGDDDLWVPIVIAFPAHGALVHHAGRLVAHWGLQFLPDDLVARFRAGLFVEPELSPERLIRPLLPGRYFAYCPVVVIARGHEAAVPHLLSSFSGFLADLAARDVFLDGIGAAAVTPEGRRFCADLGFGRLCAHRSVPDYEMWELPGAALSGSVLLSRDRALAAAYRRAFAPQASAG